MGITDAILGKKNFPAWESLLLLDAHAHSMASVSYCGANSDSFTRILRIHLNLRS